MRQLVAAVLCICGIGTIAQAEQQLAGATIVIFNSSVPESAELAKFYAQKRGIARDHLVGLACSRDEEISREDYDRTIRDPLREVFQQRKWWTLRDAPDAPLTVATNSIRFVALMKGMPLKIKAAQNYPGDRVIGGPVGGRNDASVDSEVAVLARFSSEISGALTNPYFQSYRAIGEANDPALLLVCRLDAPTSDVVRRMISDAIETEKNGLWGRAYIDGAHNTTGGFQVGDQWLSEIPAQMHKVGVPVIYDERPEIFPDGFPMNDCALYFGWYTATAAGPFADPGFHLVPGAIAVHIHSFSASTLRDPNAAWAGPLLMKGAAATLGNVYEPYLQLTAHLNVFSDRLLHGFTFAESAYMAMPTLSWMGVAIGDPLYRPYASWLQLDAKTGGTAAGNWRIYHDFAIANASKPPREYRAAARAAAARAKNGAMIEDLGLMESREGNHAAACSYFEQARTLYSTRDDLVRVALEEADSWLEQGKRKRALDIVRAVGRIVTDAPTAALFRRIEQRASAATPSTPKR
ncbi:MAG: TIGR03790 family protein [Verrucomicrobiota bacterium]|nr:TIGR03790 family protein [Verrucomicrobiota bacterium]